MLQSSSRYLHAAGIHFSLFVYTGIHQCHRRVHPYHRVSCAQITRYQVWPSTSQNHVWSTAVLYYTVVTTRAIDLLRYFSWAGSVGTSLASQSSHLNTASFFYLLGLSSFSLFPTLLLCFDFLNFILFVSSAVSSFLYYLLQIRFVRTRFSSFEHFICRWVSTAAVPLTQQSTAQSPLHKAANQSHADQSTYVEVSK